MLYIPAKLIKPKQASLHVLILRRLRDTSA